MHAAGGGCAPLGGGPWWSGAGTEGAQPPRPRAPRPPGAAAPPAHRGTGAPAGHAAVQVRAAASGQWAWAPWAVQCCAAAERDSFPLPKPAVLPLASRNLLPPLLPGCVGSATCRKLLEEEEGEPSPLRLPSFSMSGREAFVRGVDAGDVLGGGAEAAAVGLLEPGVLPFQRCGCVCLPEPSCACRA